MTAPTGTTADQSVVQLVRVELDAELRKLVLEGKYITDEIAATLLAEAQDTALLRVMEAMPPELRTLAATIRGELRVVVSHHLWAAAHLEQGNQP